MSHADAVGVAVYDAVRGLEVIWLTDRGLKQAGGRWEKETMSLHSNQRHLNQFLLQAGRPVRDSECPSHSPRYTFTPLLHHI